MFAEASRYLRRLIPYDAAVWRATDPVTGLMTAPIRAENLDDEGCAVYWGCELFTEEVNLFRDLARAEVPVASLRESTGGLPTRSMLYHDFMRPRGLDDELRAVLRVGGRPRGHISLFRSKGRSAFDPADARLVEGLVTPLAKRLRSFAQPVPESLTDPPTSAEHGPGLLLFDARGTLISVNDDARQYLEDLPDGPSTATALGVRVPAWIHSTATQARAIAQDRGRGTARVRTRTRAGRWLVCHASCLREAGGALGASAVVIEPAKASEIVPLIAEAYELSDRELEITQYVARGLPTGEIAKQLFLSPHTVRDHIKAVFEKVGVSSRGELVGRLFTEHYAPLAERRIVRVVDN
ncbi:helix-turn-helix transcriptional regulator [Streptomyces sp. H27-D2]|uniref:helix-turn-helix transcriptional regulator n=1 Tax=Streptomyces sp. H27-D2 TaxID=3046304 RepID=UPI002DB8AF67|nr:helix-turn-helix transcriptional regulator [Streptomyces sp. H27-D2]MEC4019419.1 helix-turn-helix transcriptional regulator [Streptomyces sp. H27-D2]